jgi:hypothetical protein
MTSNLAAIIQIIAQVIILIMTSNLAGIIQIIAQVIIIIMEMGMIFTEKLKLIEI